jgi:hypothetical protein
MINYNAVYDVLVSLAGAPENSRIDFIFHHTIMNPICDEWRFQGKFGYGGKYRSDSNTIDYYKEHSTKELDKLRDSVNTALKEMTALIF